MREQEVHGDTFMSPSTGQTQHCANGDLAAISLLFFEILSQSLLEQSLVQITSSTLCVIVFVRVCVYITSVNCI